MVAALLAGCQEEVITRYTVERVPDRDRMLAVMLPDAATDQVWFFKLAGPNESVAASREEFEAFVQSVQLPAGGKGPQWKLPEGWTEAPASEMRFATIQFSKAGDPLEISVSALPKPPGDDIAFQLPNLNRWRGQLGLASIDPEELAHATERLEVGGIEATFVDMTGRLQRSSMGGAPFANQAGPAAGPPGTESPTPAPRDIPLVYELPSDWRPAALDGVSAAAFTVPGDTADGERSARVTISALGSQLSLLDNVNRWRDQVGLQQIQEDALAEHAQAIEAGPLTGQLVAAMATADSGLDRAIVAAILPGEGQDWYIKLDGPVQLVQRERARFEKFVQSIRLK